MLNGLTPLYIYIHINIGLARRFVWVFPSHLMGKRGGNFWPTQSTATASFPYECVQGLSMLKLVSVLHSFSLLCNPLKK